MLKMRNLLYSLFLSFASLYFDGSTNSSSIDQSSIVNQINRFSFKFYRSLLNSTESNPIFSPLSISLAAGMLLYGANGTTAEEMLDFFEMENKEELLHEIHSKLMKIYGQTEEKEMEKGRGALVKAGNLLLISNTCTPLESYLEHVRTEYAAYVERVDFKKSPNLSKASEWIRNATEGKVNEIPQDSIDPEARLVLINTVYFKGQWVKAFDAKLTREKVFHNYDGTQSEVNMMYVQGIFKYKEFNDRKLTMVELPYKGNFSMYLAVPHAEGHLLSAVEALHKKFDGLVKELDEEEIILRLPKFKLETGIDLKQVLINLGLKGPFSPAADFSKISGKEILYVSEARQECLMEINEQGTEASGLTSFKMYARSMFFGPELTVNRPFAFVIRDNSLGMNLFQALIRKF